MVLFSLSLSKRTLTFRSLTGFCEKIYRWNMFLFYTFTFVGQVLAIKMIWWILTDNQIWLWFWYFLKTKAIPIKPIDNLWVVSKENKSMTSSKNFNWNEKSFNELNVIEVNEIPQTNFVWYFALRKGRRTQSQRLIEIYLCKITWVKVFYLSTSMTQLMFILSA